MPKLSIWKEEVKKIHPCIQRQDSTIDQLKDLHAIANLLGFYDAADYIKERVYNK